MFRLISIECCHASCQQESLSEERRLCAVEVTSSSLVGSTPRIPLREGQNSMFRQGLDLSCERYYTNRYTNVSI